LSFREALPQTPAEDRDSQTDARGGADWNGAERREDRDRRTRPTQILDSLSLRGRRGRGRRLGESKNSYVDVYQRGDVLMLLAIFILNVFDALFTLIWLRKGGIEGNPVMDLLIRAGDGVFLAQKCVVVGVWLLVLTIHKNFRVARLGMWMLLVLYLAVLIYHFYLQLSGVSPVIAVQG
jgi:hypothetical protein